MADGLLLPVRPDRMLPQLPADLGQQAAQRERGRGRGPAVRAEHLAEQPREHAGRLLRVLAGIFQRPAGGYQDDPFRHVVGRRQRLRTARVTGVQDHQRPADPLTVQPGQDVGTQVQLLAAGTEPERVVDSPAGVAVRRPAMAAEVEHDLLLRANAVQERGPGGAELVGRTAAEAHRAVRIAGHPVRIGQGGQDGGGVAGRSGQAAGRRVGEADERDAWGGGGHGALADQTWAPAARGGKGPMCVSCVGCRNGDRNNFRVCAHRFVVSLNSLGNSQPATARLPNEFKETTNGPRIEGSRADVRNQEVISAHVAELSKLGLLPHEAAMGPFRPGSISGAGVLGAAVLEARR